MSEEAIAFLPNSKVRSHSLVRTSKPLEQPLKGFLPNQPNLPSAVQSWIDEIG